MRIQNLFSIIMLAAFIAYPNIGITDPLFRADARIDYLIVTTEQRGIRAQAERLASWKWEKGLRTGIMTVDSISKYGTGKDIQQKIRNAIKDAHYQDGAMWVCIIGDFRLIPTRDNNSSDVYRPYDSVIISDLYYACLEGEWDPDNNGIIGDEESDVEYQLQCHYTPDGKYVCDHVEPAMSGVDLWNDVYIGRLPASNADEARIMIDKIMAYRSTPRPRQYADDIFFTGVQLFGLWNQLGSEWEMDDVTYFWHYGIRPYFMNTSSLFRASSIYEMYEDSVLPNGRIRNDTLVLTPQMMSEQLSRGYNLAFLSFHGKPSAIRIWSNTPRSNFTQDDVLQMRSEYYSNIISISCSVMEMKEDSQMCFAKSFLVNPNGGGVSYTGASAVDFYSMRTEHYVKAAQLLNTQNIHRIAQAYELANVMTINRYSQFVVQHWGDPELEMWSRSATAQDTFAISIVNRGGQYHVSVTPPVDSVLVCAYKKDKVFLRGYTNRGTAVFDAVDPSIDSIRLTATCPDYLPSCIYFNASDIASPVRPLVNAIGSRVPDASLIASGSRICVRFTGADRFQAAIMDVSGKIVRQTSVATAPAYWNAAPLMPGPYFLVVRANGTVINRRFIVAR